MERAQTSRTDPPRREPPPTDGGDGWDFGPPPPRGSRLDLSPLFVLLDAIRRGVPRELQDQFTSLVRESLLTLRALIDWYLERLDRPKRGPEVEEIRID
jgi:hypothetical protein